MAVYIDFIEKKKSSKKFCINQIHLCDYAVSSYHMFISEIWKLKFTMFDFQSFWNSRFSKFWKMKDRP